MTPRPTQSVQHEQSGPRATQRLPLTPAQRGIWYAQRLDPENHLPDRSVPRPARSVEQFPADAALAIPTEPIGGSDQPTSDPLVVLGPS